MALLSRTDAIAAKGCHDFVIVVAGRRQEVNQDSSDSSIVLESNGGIGIHLLRRM